VRMRMLHGVTVGGAVMRMNEDMGMKMGVVGQQRVRNRHHGI